MAERKRGRREEFRPEKGSDLTPGRNHTVPGVGGASGGGVEHDNVRTIHGSPGGLTGSPEADSGRDSWDPYNERKLDEENPEKAGREQKKRKTG